MPTLPFVNEIHNLIEKNQSQILSMGELGPILVDLPAAPERSAGGEPKVLVTGGAGYIGSHTVKELLDRGHRVLVLDSLSAGRESAVTAPVVQGSLNDVVFLDKLFTDNNISAVVHFAGSIRVDESVREPEKYFQDNVVSSINLANAMIKHGVKKLVYSSSAAVYGNPDKIPIHESDPCLPTNPYGETKLLVEDIIEHYHKVHGMSAVALRYFNAAGASLDASIGENHPAETHLIPRILDVAIKKDSVFKVFGNDYPTRDGTAVRDYVHVLDLAAVHALALDKIQAQPGLHTYNVGTGRGCSIMQVVQEVLEVTRRMVVCESHPRREGDPAILVADPTKLKTELGYDLKYSDMSTIVKTAWAWHKKLNNMV